MIELVLIAHNLRSAHNVGSLLRTAEGLGVNKVWLTGYSPYPQHEHDDRLPHLTRKIDQQITKTALGAEKLLDWQQQTDIEKVIADLKAHNFAIAALEQAPGSISLVEFQPPPKLAIIVGREVEGIELEVLALCDHILEIPMLGHKESLNVTVAAAIAIYQFKILKNNRL